MGRVATHGLNDMAFLDDGLYARFAPVICGLPDRPSYTRAELQIPSLELFSDGVVSCYYAPFDHMNTAARVVLIGITPGFTQMELAVRTARQHLRRGAPMEDTTREVKATASFAGTMRQNLIQMLDGLGLACALDIPSTSSLFGTHRHLLHSTSALRYPVFDRGGENYRGSAPTPSRHPLLQAMLDRILQSELRRVRQALVIPLGSCVSTILQELIAAGELSAAQCLMGFPHPSGANGHRHLQYAARHPEFVRKVESWFGAAKWTT